MTAKDIFQRKNSPESPFKSVVFHGLTVEIKRSCCSCATLISVQQTKKNIIHACIHKYHYVYSRAFRWWFAGTNVWTRSAVVNRRTSSSRNLQSLSRQAYRIWTSSPWNRISRLFYRRRSITYGASNNNKVGHDYFVSPSMKFMFEKLLSVCFYIFSRSFETCGTLLTVTHTDYGHARINVLAAIRNYPDRKSSRY